MRDHGRVAGLRRHLDRFERLGQRADLIRFDEDAVGDLALDALLQDGRVGHEQVVADELNLVAQTPAQERPAVPVVLGHAVLDRDDRIARDEIGEKIGKLGRAELAAFRLERIRTVREKLRARHVEPEIDVAAERKARFLDASTIVCRASSFEPRSGANPPSSPTAVFMPLALSTPFSAWKTSTP